MNIPPIKDKSKKNTPKIFLSYKKKMLKTSGEIMENHQGKQKNFSRGFPNFPPPKAEVLKKMEKILGYTFKDSGLLQQALHHPSAGGKNFESLEFLGDRALALVMSQCLLESFPLESEGDLAKRFVALTRREALLSVGDLWHLDEALIQKGHIVSGSRVLADCCEAIIGAVYRDQVMNHHEWLPFFQWLLYWWRQTSFWASTMGQETPEDSKTLLQEYLQSHGEDIPQYHLDKQEGPSHAPLFHMSIDLKGKIFKALGKTKAEAEQRVAKKALDVLKNEKATKKCF